MKIKIDKLLEGTNFPEGMDIPTQEGILLRGINILGTIPGAIALSIEDQSLTLFDAFIHPGLDYQKAFDSLDMDHLRYECRTQGRMVKNNLTHGVGIDVSHKQGLCRIHNTIIFIDIPLIEVIYELNENRFLTTGSCQDNYISPEGKKSCIFLMNDHRIPKLLIGVDHVLETPYQGEVTIHYNPNDTSIIIDNIKRIREEENK